MPGKEAILQLQQACGLLAQQSALHNGGTTLMALRGSGELLCLMLTAYWSMPYLAPVAGLDSVISTAPEFSLPAF